MKEAIIYGGAFNPPTRAHQLILQSCVDIAKCSGAEVWLLPSGERRDKSIAAHREQRINLARALCASVVAQETILKVNTVELDSTAPTETYQTHRTLTSTYPEYELTWIFGSDSICTMKQWRGGEWLFRNMGMLIVPRPGVELTELPVNSKILDIQTPDISSTEVRSRIKRGETLTDLVPDVVERVLAESVAALR